jgi:hypothetical protein
LPLPPSAKPPNPSQQTLKDLDIEGAKLYLGPKAKAGLMLQLSEDSYFLQSCGVMDYSLLVGVAHYDNTADVPDVSSSIHRQSCFHSVGYPDPNAKELYFIGIIDIFIHYGVKKSMESATKSIVYETDAISCVPPDKYAERFCSFMLQLFK